MSDAPKPPVLDVPGAFVCFEMVALCQGVEQHAELISLQPGYAALANGPCLVFEGLEGLGQRFIEQAEGSEGLAELFRLHLAAQPGCDRCEPRA